MFRPTERPDGNYIPLPIGTDRHVDRSQIQALKKVTPRDFSLDPEFLASGRLIDFREEEAACLRPRVLDSKQLLKPQTAIVLLAIGLFGLVVCKNPTAERPPVPTTPIPVPPHITYTTPRSAEYVLSHPESVSIPDRFQPGR